MEDFGGQWIEILREGTFTASDGEEVAFSAEDIETLARTYSPAIHDAPIVVGHPETNAPAYGWVSELRVRRNGHAALEMRARSVEPEFEEMVKAGRFEKRSVSVYKKFEPTGGRYLEHVGFLGAVPPAVKGLKPVEFSEPGKVFKLEMKEATMPDKTVKEEIRDFFAELFGKKPEASAFTEQQVQERIAAAQKPLLEKVDALSTKFDESVKAAQTRAASSDAEARKSRVAAFIEKLKAANKYVPAFDEHGLPGILEKLSAISDLPDRQAGTVKFGEGDKAKEVTLFDGFCAFLEAQREIVPTGELAKALKGKGGKVIQFTPAKTIGLAEGSIAVNERAEELAAKEKIPFGEALRRARAESGEPVAGGATAGAV